MSKATLIKVKTLQEPVVVHHCCQYDGTREMADELLKLLSVDIEGLFHTPSFSYRPGTKDVRIDRYFLREGDYFKISRTNPNNSEPGFEWMLTDVGPDFNHAILGDLILIEEKPLDLGR